MIKRNKSIVSLLIVGSVINIGTMQVKAYENKLTSSRDEQVQVAISL